MSSHDTQKLLGAIGGHVRWEIRKCGWCGADARFPILNINLSRPVKPMCDRCEIDSRHDAERVEQRFDADKAFERSGAPDDETKFPRIDLPFWASDFVTNQRAGLYLYGPVGTKKTSLASEILRSFAKRGTASRYATERDYAAACFKSDREKMEKMKSIPVLVVDDLGTDYQSDFSASLFFDLVDARYRLTAGKTIWISNYSPKELKQFQHVDARVTRRIGDTCHDPIRIGEQTLEVAG